MKAGSTAMTQRPRNRVSNQSMLAIPDSRRPDRANPPTNFWLSLFLTALAWSTCSGFPLDRQSTRNTMLTFYGSSGRDSVRRGQWHFHQDNAPVHNSILVTDYLSKMGIKTVPQPLYSPDFAPCDFWLFPKLRGCRYETIEEMRATVTKVVDTLSQVDFHWAFEMLLEKFQQVHCNRGRLLQRGIEFHVCIISKSAHSKKVWKLI